jgi:2-methylcitrate dehydratase PrpD
LYALGIAGTQAGGLKRVFGTMCKPFHAGAASQGGLMAAMLAAEGFNSAEDILEGANGFFQAFRGAPDPESIASLGRTWAIEGLDQKYHASCHFTHSPIEAVLEVVNANHLECPDIKSVRVEVSELAVDTAGIPEPATGLEGKFSLRYCVANALQRRVTGLAAFTNEKVNDPEIKEFMEKVTIAVTDDIRDMSWTARAKIEDQSGEVYESEVDVGTKIYGIEVKKERIGAKFADLCTPVLGSETTKDLAELLSSMDKLDNVRGFVSRVP